MRVTYKTMNLLLIGFGLYFDEASLPVFFKVAVFTCGSKARFLSNL